MDDVLSFFPLVGFATSMAGQEAVILEVNFISQPSQKVADAIAMQLLLTPGICIELGHALLRAAEAIADAAELAGTQH